MAATLRGRAMSRSLRPDLAESSGARTSPHRDNASREVVVLSSSIALAGLQSRRPGERGDEVVDVEDEPEGEGNPPQAQLLGQLASCGLLVLHGGHGLP